MKIEEGFKINEPDVFIPWNIKEKALSRKLKKYGLRKVGSGYYTIACEPLIGLRCMLGFHFELTKNGILEYLEFFRKDYSDIKKSFENFQFHFEKTFGKPTSERDGDEGYKNYEWDLDTVQISHYVYDRFGPEEHMLLEKTKRSTKQKKSIFNYLWSFINEKKITIKNGLLKA